MSNLHKNKKGNVIQRTTSETLRLGDDFMSIRNPNVNRASGSETTPRKKSPPSSSFQITGITIHRADYDDSTDDFDESPRDDISRITDIETPSFSEDSRSTDDPQQILCNNPGALLQQPLPVIDEKNVETKTEKELEQLRNLVIDDPIPNYLPICTVGIACIANFGSPSSVSPESPERSTIKQISEGAEASINDPKPTKQFGRFRIVRITDPIPNYFPVRRGRWTCFDYSDKHARTMHPELIICDDGATRIKETIQGTIRTTVKEINKLSKNSQATQTSNISADDSSNENYIQICDSNWIPPSNLNNNNCQESYVYSGSIVVPQKAPTTFSIPLERRPGSVRYHCPETTVVFPARYPIYSTARIPSSLNRPRVDGRTAITNVEAEESFISGQEGGRHGIAVRFTEQLVPLERSAASVSCTATIEAAIDAKIEMALDLVKDHLARAINMEVEKLRTKINELRERIHYLEYENHLLRANVAPEVLTRLNNMGRK